MDDNPTSTLLEVHTPFLLQAVKSLLWASSSGVNCPQNFNMVSTTIHRLDLGPLLTGMALSSVRMHRYSPITAINAMQATLTSHQDRAAGRWALYIQQPIIWKKCTVTVKSRHCFPRRMKSHRPRALQKQWHRKVMLSAMLIYVSDKIFVDTKMQLQSCTRTKSIEIIFYFYVNKCVQSYWWKSFSCSCEMFEQQHLSKRCHSSHLFGCTEI